MLLADRVPHYLESVSVFLVFFVASSAIPSLPFVAFFSSFLFVAPEWAVLRYVATLAPKTSIGECAVDYVYLVISYSGDAYINVFNQVFIQVT